MKNLKSALLSSMSAALLVFGLAMFAAVNAQHDTHPSTKAATPADKPACCGGTDGKPGCCSSEACAKAQAAGHTAATASESTTGCRCCGDSCPLAKPATATTGSAAHASMAMGKTAATTGDSGCPCCGDSCQKPTTTGGTATAGGAAAGKTEGGSCCNGNDSCCAKPATPPTTTAPPKGN